MHLKNQLREKDRDREREKEKRECRKTQILLYFLVSILISLIVVQSLGPYALNVLTHLHSKHNKKTLTQTHSHVHAHTHTYTKHGWKGTLGWKAQLTPPAGRRKRFIAFIDSRGGVAEASKQHTHTHTHTHKLLHHTSPVFPFWSFQLELQVSIVCPIPARHSLPHDPQCAQTKR